MDDFTFEMIMNAYYEAGIMMLGTMLAFVVVCFIWSQFTDKDEA